MTRPPPQPPDGWGKDSLTQYLDNCRYNQWAAFANKRSQVIDLTTIDGLFRKLVGDAVNPRPVFPLNFLLRAHSAYLSACCSVLAGQLNEAWALLRVCLEQGGYAHYIGDDDKRWEFWMRRHDQHSQTQQRKWRDEFSHGKVSRHLKAEDADVGSAYDALYERAIDYGAHPNERGASVSTDIENMEDGGIRFHTIYLHPDGVLLDLLLRTAAQVGICVLRIAQLIYPLRSQATGVQFQLDTISKRF